MGDNDTVVLRVPAPPLPLVCPVDPAASVTGLDVTAPIFLDSAVPTTFSPGFSMLRPAASANNGVIRLLQNSQPVAGSGSTIPSIFDAPAEELTNWASAASDRYLRQQRDDLLQIPACQPFQLSQSFDMLPEIFQNSMAAFRNDPEIYFRVESVTEGGQTVPQLRFFRVERRPSADHTVTTLTHDTTTGDVTLSGLGVGASGMALMGRVIPDELALRPGGGGSRSPLPTPEGSPALMRLGVSVGGAVLMYGIIDATVSRLPRELQAPAGIAEGVLLYSTAYNTSELLVQRGILQTGFMSAPRWGQIAQTAPHLFVAQYGAAYLFDGLGIAPIGSRGNQFLSFGTSTGLYLAGPSIAARYPAIGTAFNSSLGLGLTPMTTASGATMSALGGRVFLAGGGPAGGAGIMGGGFQVVGAVGVVALANWETGAIWDIAAWANGWSNDPDYRFMMWAWDRGIHGAGGLFGDIFNPLIKMIQIYHDYAVSDRNSIVTEGVDTVQSGLIRDINGFANSTNESLVNLLVNSLDEGPNGTLNINWDRLQANVQNLYGRYSDRIGTGYDMINFVAPTSRRSEIDTARELSGVISRSGNITSDRNQMEQFLRRILPTGPASWTLRANVRSVLRANRDDLARRASELHLDRPIAENQLTPAQRTFLHGDGQNPSEMIIRRRQIDTLQRLLDRFERFTTPEALVQPVAAFQAEVLPVRTAVSH